MKKNKGLTWIYSKLLKKLMLKYKGVPILVVVYKPWVKGKNVIFNSLIEFDSDEYLLVRYKEIAEHIRSNYQEDMDKALEESKNEN